MAEKSGPTEPSAQRTVIEAFQSFHYQRHNRRRQEHLAGLGLDLAGKTVLELGAGIGDHTDFFLDRGCRVVTTEARPENLQLLRARFPAKKYPHVEVRALDLDGPDEPFTDTFDIVYSYGILYHLAKPAEAIAFMARRCRGLLLLETCVSFGDEDATHPCEEPSASPSQSVRGRGCRPTRKWVFNQLRWHFEFVYVTRTQPWHEEFPTDWTTAPPPGRLTRSVLVASRHPLRTELLVADIPVRQTR